MPMNSKVTQGILTAANSHQAEPSSPRESLLQGALKTLENNVLGGLMEVGSHRQILP